MILLIGAMEEELHQLVADIKATPVKNSLVREFLTPDKKVLVAYTGIGLVNAATALTYLLTKYQGQISQIVNAGTAGCLDKHHLKRGDLVVVENAYLSTADSTGFGYVHGQLPGMPPHYSTDDKIRANLANCMANNHYVFANTASSDMFFESQAKINEYTSKLPAEIAIAEMECAALMQTAHIFNVPIGAIKIVSDVIGNEDPNEEQFDQFLPKAALKLSEVIRAYLK
ncbi:5'-methylthioadenosine/S-adenosylhomocysteine nucleosidase [Mesoplasma seiffertii]|uniref:5'-methylthioadenosine/S-adenosylhomocysteine nucleosidase n=1 Tax=Mesoplasma seiffertii TaxID=28224 RepID=UPI0004BB6ECA|nr:5'-methylthioadenosine/S-adenosylhomocysteine nucleosidase [Mesoplasma seiffertii]